MCYYYLGILTSSLRARVAGIGSGTASLLLRSHITAVTLDYQLVGRLGAEFVNICLFLSFAAWDVRSINYDL